MDLSRRAFLSLGLGTCLCGCMGTYLRDDEEILLPRPRPEPTPAKEEPEVLPLDTPIYEHTDGGPTPDLSPISRRSWALLPQRISRLHPMGRIWRLTVHHEGAPLPNLNTSPRAVARNLRQIMKVHMEQNRAGDIGYHFIIDRAGRVWQGRPLDFRGAHAGGKANVGNLGVMLLGNFDIQEPSLRQKATLQAFLEKLMAEKGLSGRRILTHREIKATRCPGKNLQRFVDAIRRSL